MHRTRPASSAPTSCRSTRTGSALAPGDRNVAEALASPASRSLMTAITRLRSDEPGSLAERRADSREWRLCDGRHSRCTERNTPRLEQGMGSQRWERARCPSALQLLPAISARTVSLFQTSHNALDRPVPGVDHLQRACHPFDDGDHPRPSIDQVRRGVRRDEVAGRTASKPPPNCVCQALRCVHLADLPDATSFFIPVGGNRSVPR